MKSRADAILRTEQAAYLEALEPPRDLLLAEMEAVAAEHRRPITDPEVASFLAVLARASAPRIIVELGTNIGYGAIVLARAAGAEARVVTIEIDRHLCEMARGYVRRAGMDERIEVRQGAALTELARIESIDFAYVDCVKEEYPQYFSLLAERLSPRGVIVADNVLWKGLVARAFVDGADGARVPPEEAERVDALHRFNQLMVQDERLRGVVLPLGDGVAVATRLA